MPPAPLVSWLLLSFVTLIYWIAPQSVRLLYAIRLAEFGSSDLLIGVIVGGSTVASLLLAVPSGYLIDRLDGRLALFSCSLLLALVSAAFAVAREPLHIAVLMLLQAVLSMWVWLTLQAAITYAGDHPTGVRQLNIFSLAWGVGMAAGPVLVAGVYDAADFETMALLCAGMIAIGTAAVPFTPNVKELRAAPSMDAHGTSTPEQASLAKTLRDALRDPIIIPIMVCGFVNIYVFSLRISFYPVFLERVGLPLSLVGTLLSIIGITSLAVRIILPWAVGRFGNLRLLIWSTWVAIGGLVVVPTSPTLPVQVCAAIMIGTGLGSNPVISVNLLASTCRTPPGIAMGLRLLSNRAGQVVQPVVFGAVAASVGLVWAFPISGVLLGATTIWVSSRLSRS